MVDAVYTTVNTPAVSGSFNTGIELAIFHILQPRTIGFTSDAGWTAEIYL